MNTPPKCHCHRRSAMESPRPTGEPDGTRPQSRRSWSGLADYLSPETTETTVGELRALPVRPSGGGDLPPSRLGRVRATCRSVGDAGTVPLRVGDVARERYDRRRLRGDELLNMRARTWRWLAVLPVVALLAGFFVYLASTTSPPCQRGCLEKTGPVLPTVATNLTPSGWIALPYGNIQISVPASWAIGVLDCPGLTQADGWVSLDGITPTNPPTACPNETHFPPNQVFIGPNSGPVLSTASVVTVNGFDAYVIANSDSGVSPAYEVPFPSLDTEIRLEGPMASSVLHSLTYSPRAVALAPGAAPPIPSSWHRIFFGGISAAVPKSWPVLSDQGWGGCLPTNPSLRHADVVLTTGTIEEAPPCAPFPAVGVEKATDGLLVDPGRYGPTESETTTVESCIAENHLSVCPTSVDRYGVFVASIHLPGRGGAVVIEVGLAENGMTARTILRSLRLEH
jgi:hypothetical protein